MDLCKQIEEVVTAVPDLERFARDLMRESLGMKPTGRPKNVNVNSGCCYNNVGVGGAVAAGVVEPSKRW